MKFPVFAPEYQRLHTVLKEFPANPRSIAYLLNAVNDAACSEIAKTGVPEGAHGRAIQYALAALQEKEDG